LTTFSKTKLKAPPKKTFDGGIPAAAAFVLSKRAKQSSDVGEELSKLQQELDRARSHAARIQRKVQEEQTMSACAH
jgi:hypothetical protein